jgi:hypothetical protein
MKLAFWQEMLHSVQSKSEHSVNGSMELRFFEQTMDASLPLASVYITADVTQCTFVT